MARVGTTTVIDLTSTFYAKLLILRQNHTGWTGAGHVSVLVITQMGTTAVIFVQTLVLVRARRTVLGQGHSGRTGAKRLAVLVPTTEMRASPVVDGTCVYLDARFAVVL